MTPRKRLLIGTVNGAATRQRVYRIDDGLEMDDIDHYEVTRKRVYFDEVLAMTYHKETGWLFVLVVGLPGLFFVGLAFFTHDELSVFFSFLLLGLLFLLPAVLRLLFKVDVITVFGKRTRIRMKFGLRKRAAQKHFVEISTAVRSVQSRLASQLEQEPAVAPPSIDPLAPPLPPE